MHQTSKLAVACTLLLCSSFISPAPLRAADALAWPPLTSQTRPWAWWWWHGSAVDQTNIALQLQQFHDAGLGGVQITSIYGTKGAEARDIPYLTPGWLAMMGYTVDEAGRLGMGVDMTLGSGWCFGGPTVTDRDANATAVVKTYTVTAGQKLTEKFQRNSIQALIAFPAAGKAVELTHKISADGAVNWAAPAGTWTVYAVSQKPSGQKVKRPGPGGEGWMLNPLYPQAVTDWLKWFDTAFAHYTGPKPQAVFQDSYEYRTDWSPDFFKQFAKRRGYKLQDELPALFGDISRITHHASLDHVARVKYDYRRTVSEIMAQQSEPAWIDWAHQNGFSTIYQAHGTPGNWLDLYGDADLPETEMFHNDRSILVSKFASSAAHTQGHPLTGAETGTWLKEHFTATLADLKYLADDMFLSGVNHIYYHGACYSPADAPWPGWVFYASTEMNPRNSIWHDVPALNEYIARCQSILQSGRPDNDVLLYWPIADLWSDPAGLIQTMSVSAPNWFEGQPIAKTAHELWNQGYAFDYVSDAQLLQAKVVAGKIQMPGGSYRVIVVPECKFIPYQTFEQLLALVDKGAVLIFEKLPVDLAGMEVSKVQQAEFTNQIAQIKRTLRPPAYLNCPVTKFGKGEVWVGRASWAWPSAFSEGDLVSKNLYFVRRAFEHGRNYFIVNRGTANFDGWISLDYWPAAKSVILLDPSTGYSGVAPQNTNDQIHLQLAAGQSVILRAFADNKVEGSAWACWQTNGAPTEIPGNWNVSFVQGGPTLPAPFQTSQLGSWTASADTSAQAFAGTAKYETTFDAPNPQSAVRSAQFFLNLGDVRQSARVMLNGKFYGTLITPPFRVVVDNLKPTGNVLDVEVTSVAANRIRDLDRRGVNWKIFKDINLVNENYQPFNAADWPLTDCGLLGPVTLTPVTAE